MHVLVTGATGFVGGNLIPYLRHHLENVKLTSLVRKRWKENDIEWSQLDSNALSGFDAVIHLAGKAHDTNNISGEKEYFRVNYELTKTLYDLYIKSEATKFIFMSSVKAAADVIEGSLNEEEIPKPKTPYGQSKLKAEEYIIQNSSLRIQNSIILRPCMIHGPGNKGNLNLLYQFAKRGIPYPLACFENQRSFLSVENLCFVIKNLLEHHIESGIYNVADDESLSTVDLIKIMAEVNHRKAKLWRVPKEVVRQTAKMGDKFSLPFNTERLQKLTESYVVNNDKIKSSLQIKHFPMAAKEGLYKTIKSFNQID